MKRFSILLCATLIAFGVAATQFETLPAQSHPVAAAGSAVSFPDAKDTAIAKCSATIGNENVHYDEAAVDEYNRSIGLTKVTLQCLQQGNAESRIGKFKTAVECFNRAIALNPRYASAFDCRGNARADLGDRAGAERDYRTAIKLNPKVASPWNNLGTLKDSFDPAGALDAYSESIRIYPDCVAFDNRGTVKDRLGDVQGAKRDFDKAIKLNPKYARAYADRGFFSFRNDKLQDSLSDYNQAINMDHNFAWAYSARGNVLSELGRNVLALADFNEAIRLDPTNAQFYRDRGRERAHNCVDLQGSLEDINHAVSLDPKNTDGLTERGDARLRIGDRAGAINDFLLAIRIDEHCMRAYCLLGDARLDRRQAIQDFSRAMIVDPTYEPVYHERGFELWRLGDLHGAIRDFSEAIKLRPNYGLTYNSRAHLRSRIGDTAGAIADLGECIRLDSRIRCRSYCERAIFRVKNADIEGAIQDCSAAVRINGRETFEVLNWEFLLSLKELKPNWFAGSAKLWQETMSGIAAGAFPKSQLFK